MNMSKDLISRKYLL